MTNKNKIIEQIQNANNDYNGQSKRHFNDILVPNSKKLPCVTTNQNPYQNEASLKISKTNKMHEWNSIVPTI